MKPAQAASPPSQPARVRPIGEADLARSRAGQELGERDEIGEGALGEPAAPRDEFAAEIADMGDRPAERGQAELEEGEEDLAGGGAPAAIVAPRASRLPP